MSEPMRQEPDPDPSTVKLVPCQYCNRLCHAPTGLTNHERGCQLNPARRPQKRRSRKICPKCRTMVDSGNFPRHVKACRGRREDVVISESAISPAPAPVAVEPTTPNLLPTSTTELLVELLFPHGMPTHPEFVRAFRAWMEATDQLVAIAGVKS